jgi:hypothetical protein
MELLNSRQLPLKSDGISLEDWGFLGHASIRARGAAPSPGTELYASGGLSVPALGPCDWHLPATTGHSRPHHGKPSRPLRDYFPLCKKRRNLNNKSV